VERVRHRRGGREAWGDCCMAGMVADESCSTVGSLCLSAILFLTSEYQTADRHATREPCGLSQTRRHRSRERGRTVRLARGRGWAISFVPSILLRWLEDGDAHSFPAAARQGFI